MKKVELRANLAEAQAGDLIFVTSPYVRGIKTENQTAFHVGLVAGENTLICATNSELGVDVVEIPIDTLLITRQFISVGKVKID